MAEWKAAFIEDCDELHLARKPVFASTIYRWIQDPDVEDAFRRNAPRGEKRLEELKGMSAAVFNEKTARLAGERREDAQGEASGV